MAKPIVTGIMSYGMSGRIFHAPFIEAHFGFKLKAITERSKKVAAERYPDIISYNSNDELLNDDEIELAIVNTPNYTHYDLAKQALKAGKHVLIEKPAAAKLEQIKELFDLGRQQNKQVLIYQNRRWDSDFLSIKQVIESGKLGQLSEVTFRFDRFKPAISPKIFKETASTPASGLVFDLGPHLLDQIISLFGKPLSFNKTTGKYRPGTEVDDYFFFHLKYPNQLNVFAISNLMAIQPVPAFVIQGTAGSYIKDRVDRQEEQLDKSMLPTDDQYGSEADGVEGKLFTMNADGSKNMELIPSLKGDYMGLFEAAYQSIRNGVVFPVTEDHILAQMELLQA
jgi:scyllo-inositol 2-dehydrogenase (NADP+)